MNDCEEMIANTDPMDPNSVLWLQIMRTGTPDVQQLRFPTSIGRTYRIDSSTNLYSNDWSTVFSNLPGLGSNMNLIHTNQADRMYYRIGVESP
jgi:hypothetical protein